MGGVSQNVPPPGYGPPSGYGQAPYSAPREHPQATTILVLGILGLVLCQVLSVFAWVMGNRVVQEIDASGGQLGGRGMANAGRICGIVGSIMLGMSLVLLLLFLVVGLGVMSSP
jgi:hypothetical protein